MSDLAAALDDNDADKATLVKLFDLDPFLKPCEAQISQRIHGYKWWKAELEKHEGGLERFAEGYNMFGFNRAANGYTFREWLPNAKQVFLIGEFNKWENTVPLSSEGFGKWVVDLPDGADGQFFLPHRCQLKLRIETPEGQWIERLPAWTKLALQDKSTNLYNALFWEPPADEQYKFRYSRPAQPPGLKIYEAHVGMSSLEPKVSTYLEFADFVLPRIKQLGYNALQLMAVAEHAYYGCFGYHVTSFFAPAGRSGTPEELKELVDRAHGLGIVVLVDLVHAHCSSNSLDGIAMMDGTDHCYTHGGPKGHQAQWDSKLFYYTKHEVLRFLLSNIRWWLEEYRFDGFRFDGVTSMLYHSHGIGKGFGGGYPEYFGPDADVDSHIFLMLANDLIKSLVPSAVSVAEDVSGMPTLCVPVEDGGFGFDYRLAMAVPDMLFKLLKVPDEQWDMGNICHTLTNRRWKEKCIAYAESHDQCIVGDKTIACQLMDAEMYTGMSTSTPAPLVVDRGLALHKMIRLLVLGLGGEGYLSFMGNEFGHPEWVDFPRAENGWSHHHCRRRWDLADDINLRFKFLQSFDQAMHSLEERFGWLAAEHQYVSVQHEEDKVIAFERGELLFVFNFHPQKSYEDYRIGCKWAEPMRLVFDSDASLFGGHHRLQHGHENPCQPLEECHSRPASIGTYLPSRTAQVFVRESLLIGGIRVWLEEDFLLNRSPSEIADFVLVLEPSGDTKEAKKFKFDSDRCVKLEALNGVTFSLLPADAFLIKSEPFLGGLFHVYAPGNYTLSRAGFLRYGKPKRHERALTGADAMAKKSSADIVCCPTL